MALENPPIFSDNVTPPAPGQVLRVAANGEDWEPVTVTAAALAVPQPAIAAFGAVAAATGGTVATADGADPATTQALANALKAAHNLTAADVATLVTELSALRVKFNQLLTEVASAGVLSP